MAAQGYTIDLSNDLDQSINEGIVEKTKKSKLMEEMESFLKKSPFTLEKGLMPSLLFADKFEIENIDKGKKKFDKVSRVQALSSHFKVDLVLDYNCELIQLDRLHEFHLGLAACLSDTENISDDPTAYLKPAQWNETHSPETVERFDYIMYGKVYRYEKADDERMVAYISFGGLLMSLTGLHYHLEMVRVNNYVYLLLK